MWTPCSKADILKLLPKLKEPIKTSGASSAAQELANFAQIANKGYGSKARLLTIGIASDLIGKKVFGLAGQRWLEVTEDCLSKSGRGNFLEVLKIISVEQESIQVEFKDDKGKTYTVDTELEDSIATITSSDIPIVVFVD